MSLILQGSTSGSITLQEPAVAGTTVLDLPATSGNVVVDSATQTLTNKTIEGGTVISGTAVSASSTSVDFTSIPLWVKRVTVMFSGISTNGTSIIQVQLGDSGGVETTGYVGGYTSNGVSGGILSGFPLSYVSTTAVSEISGSLTLSLVNASTNTWVGAGTQGRLSGGVAQEATAFGGGKSLSATLDRVRITTVNGTDTFDAGSINILYE